jgi:signal transduction histidine kinase
VGRLAGQAATDLRQVVAELRPPDLAERGLVETLRARAALLDRVHSASVSFATVGRVDLPPAAAETVLRVAEEALHNALRHGRATRVQVRLTRERKADTGVRGGVVLEVRDDGVGFSATAARHGLGLASMRDRARTVGGRLELDTSGGGTTVRLEVPGDRAGD